MNKDYATSKPTSRRVTLLLERASSWRVLGDAVGLVFFIIWLVCFFAIVHDIWKG